MVGLAFTASVLGSCIWMLAGDWHEVGQQWQAIVKDLYLAHVPPNDTLSDILASSHIPSSTSYSSTTGPGHEPYRVAAYYEYESPRLPLEHERDALPSFTTPTIDAATQGEPSLSMDKANGDGADMLSSNNVEDGTKIQWAEEPSPLLAHLTSSHASSQTFNTEFPYRNGGVVWRAEAILDPESEIRHVAIPEVVLENNYGDVLSRAEPSISHKPSAPKVELRLLPTLVLCSGWLFLLSVLLRDPEDVVDRCKRALWSVTGKAAPNPLENRYAAFDDYFWTEPHKPRPKPKVATSSVAEAQPTETSTTTPKSAQRVRSVTENPWARKEIPFVPSLIAKGARRRHSQGFDVGATVSISSLRSLFSGTNNPLFLRGQPKRSLEQDDERTIENRHCPTCRCIRAGSSGKAST